MLFEANDYRSTSLARPCEFANALGVIVAHMPNSRHPPHDSHGSSPVGGTRDAFAHDQDLIDATPSIHASPAASVSPTFHAGSIAFTPVR